MPEPSILNDSDFEKLLLNPEGFLIDYKRDQYCLDSKENKAKCIKDIISLANTIRQNNAYIVMGIEEIDGKRYKYKHEIKSLSYGYGITKILDDQIFQTLVKDKVSPKPKFLYYIYTDKQGNKFGIIEIFIIKGVEPFRPVNNFGGGILKSGTLYYRLGSTNEPASGDKDEEDRIFRWFHEIENQLWNEFQLACHNFDDKGRLFILISSPELKITREQLAILGRVNWSLVLDFNADTESDGLLAAVKDELSLRRAIHLFKLNDRQIFAPESASYWFAVKGLSGFQKTLVDSGWRDWNRKYSTYLRQILISFYKASADRPVTVVSIWDEPDYIRTLCQEIDNAFGDAANFVFATDNTSSLHPVIESFGEYFQADIIPINIPQILEGLRKNTNPAQLILDSEEVWLPSLDGGSVPLPVNDLRWIQEDFEIVHLNSGKREKESGETTHDFYSGMTVSWFDLNLNRDATRDITSSLAQQVRTDLKSRRSAYRINLYHEPGAGGTTVARRVAWDLHETYPTVLLNRIRTKGTVNRFYAVEETYNRIRKIYDYTDQSILVIVEASRVDLDDIEQLHTLVTSDSLPVVFLIVRRGFYEPSISREYRRHFLNSTLNDSECLRFIEKYASKFTNKRPELEKIRMSNNSNFKTPFYFGLVSYGENFISLPNYVETRLGKALESHKEIVVYLALGYHYSQRCLSSQLFAPLLEKENSKISKNQLVRLEKILPRPLLDLLICEHSVLWRPMHELIAIEIIEQVLSNGFADRRNWTQNLSTWALKIINLCGQNNRTPSNEIIDLLTHLFVLKDNQQLMGKEDFDAKTTW